MREIVKMAEGSRYELWLSPEGGDDWTPVGTCDGVPIWMTEPRCSVHGPLSWVRKPGGWWWEGKWACHGYDGEGCDEFPRDS